MSEAVVARPGRAGENTDGRLGDALSVAVVTLAVMQAATAVVVTLQVLALGGAGIVRGGGGHPFFVGEAEAAAAVVTTLVAVAAVGAMCFGRARLARLLLGATAACAAVSVAVSHATGHPWSFASTEAKAVALAGAVVLLPVLCTPVVTRAARVAPAWWWGMAALVCLAVVQGGINAASGFHWRLGAVTTGYVAQPALLLVLALPLLRSYPFVVAGTALAGAAVLPFAPYVESRTVDPAALAAFAALSWVVLGGLTALALRRARAV